MPEKPRVPKHGKPSASLGGPLDDDAEFAGLLVAGSDLSDHETHRVTLSQMQFQQCGWQRTRLHAGTLRVGVIVQPL